MQITRALCQGMIPQILGLILSRTLSSLKHLAGMTPLNPGSSLQSPDKQRRHAYRSSLMAQEAHLPVTRQVTARNAGLLLRKARIPSGAGLRFPSHASTSYRHSRESGNPDYPCPGSESGFFGRYALPYGPCSAYLPRRAQRIFSVVQSWFPAFAGMTPIGTKSALFEAVPAFTGTHPVILVLLCLLTFFRRRE